MPDDHRGAPLDDQNEVVVEGFVSPGDGPSAGWFLHLPLIGLSDEQSRRLLEQAQEVLDRFGTSQRATIVRTFEAIVEAVEQRLGIREAGPGLTPNIFILRVAPDATDPWGQIRDDRGATIAYALRYAEDPDPVLASLWRGIAEDLDVLRFSGDV